MRWAKRKTQTQPHKKVFRQQFSNFYKWCGETAYKSGRGEGRSAAGRAQLTVDDVDGAEMLLQQRQLVFAHLDNERVKIYRYFG